MRKQVQRELDRRGMTQEQLAKRVKMKPAALSKFLKGTTLKRTFRSIERLRDIERALKLPSGTLVRALALLKDPRTTRSAIQADASLPPDVKHAFELVVNHYAGVRTAKKGTAPRAQAPAEPEGLAAGSGTVESTAAEHEEKREHVRKRTSSTPPAKKRPRR
ncbi:MAG TPA: helix-turn-helix transcriptional regulator [Acidimicrobiales bacterium]|nr:helix-turn-helix transcriptional regulator [Acidimicrobiales bacterium]